MATLLRENPEVRAGLDERYRYHPGRRVPGHQPGPIRHRPGAVDRLSEPGGDRRPGPVDLRLAGGQPEQHPRVREGFSRRPRRAAGAELSQHEADPARGRRADLAQRPAQGEGPVHRERRGRAGPPGRPIATQQGRGRGDRRARSPARSPPAAAAPAISPSSTASTP